VKFLNLIILLNTLCELYLHDAIINEPSVAEAEVESL